VSDPIEERRNAAAHFGATDALDPSVDDVVAMSHSLTGGIGVDYAFDAAGHVALLEAGLKATRRGGTTVGVGAPAADQTLAISPAVSLVVAEKKLLGCLFGSCNPHREVPRLVGLWQRGALDLESMISYRRPLAEINEGFDDLRAGRGIRTVIAF
jgi:S-(hydroxymethyl)glutathione dehydrogenase/alcohol dehydrogenase